MTRNATIEDLSRAAMGNLAGLRLSTQEDWELLSQATRAAFAALEEHIEMEGAFGPGSVAAEQAYSNAVERDLAEAGGAPMQDRSDEGDLILLGGTGVSRRLWHLAEQAKACTELMRRVDTAVAAEAHLARRRSQLA